MIHRRATPLIMSAASGFIKAGLCAIFENNFTALNAWQWGRLDVNKKTALGNSLEDFFAGNRSFSATCWSKVQPVRTIVITKTHVQCLTAFFLTSQ